MFSCNVYSEMIRVEGLTKKFGEVVAIQDVDFDIAEGQTMTLIGTSGSGKTTLLKMLNRLVEPTEGKIWVNDEPVHNLSLHKLRRKMGYVIQNIGLFPHWTIARNISTVPRLQGWEKKRIKERVNEMMEMVQLPPKEYANRYPDALSGGQQQRVGLARALAHDPPIILLDEPFGALDPITRRDLQNSFIQLQNRLNKTMVLVTHDVFEAFKLGSLVCLLDEGKVQQIAAPWDLLHKPANTFVSDFFAGQRLNLSFQLLKAEDLWPEMKAIAQEQNLEERYGEDLQELTLQAGETLNTLTQDLEDQPARLHFSEEEASETLVMDLPGVIRAYERYLENTT